MSVRGQKPRKSEPPRATGDKGEIRFYCWTCMAESNVSVTRLRGYEDNDADWKIDDSNSDLCDDCGRQMVPVSEYVEEPEETT